MIIPSDQFLKTFKATPGAIGVAESIAIMNLASQVPAGGVFLECGSNAGKAAQSAAHGLPEGTFYLVDPIYDLTNLEAWKHSMQGHPDNLAWDYVKEDGFYKTVVEKVKNASGGKVKPVLLGDYSENVIPKHDNYSWVFVDADNHQKELVQAEAELLRSRMLPRGIIAFHDFGNQYHAPREVHGWLISTGEYENVDIEWELIFNHVRANNLEEGNNSWHTKGSQEFPKFVGAVRKK